MRVSYIVSISIVLLLALWLASPQLLARLNDNVEESKTDTVSESTPAKKLFLVQTQESLAEEVSKELVLNARTVSYREIDVKSEAEGRVTELPLEKGAIVEKGDVLAVIDHREKRAMLKMAEAVVKQRRLENEAARRLGQKGFQADTRVAEAQANLEEASAELERMQIDLDNTTVKAPFSGILDELPVENGDFLTKGSVVGKIVQLDPLLVEADVAEADRAGLVQGMSGRVIVANMGEFEGKATFIASKAESSTRTFLLELEISNPDFKIPAGISVELVLDTGEEKAHKISAGLLDLNDEGAIGIKAVNSSNVVEFYNANIVKSNASFVWLSDLPEELSIVSRGQGFVKAGQEVRVQPSNPPDEEEESDTDLLVKN